MLHDLLRHERLLIVAETTQEGSVTTMTNDHQDCAEHYYSKLLEEKEAHFQEITLRNTWVFGLAALLFFIAIKETSGGLGLVNAWYFGWSAVLVIYAVASTAVHYGRRSANRAAQAPKHTCQESAEQTVA